MIAAAIALPTAIGIVVRDLTLRLNNRVIFDNLRFSLDGGKCAAVLGTSGVGKTSLLKIIAGLMRPDAGTVSGSDGLPLAGRIAYMGQNDLLYPWLTVRQNITRGARQIQLTRAGERLLQASTRAFADLLAAVEDIQRAKLPPTLTLSTTSNFLTHWLVPRLALMKACCPALDLRLHTSLEVMDLTHDAVDVAIRYSMTPDETLDTTLLYEDTFMAVASPTLGLRSREGLLGATLIHVEDRYIPQPAPEWRHWRAQYGPPELNIHAGLRFTDETHAIQAAIAGQGVAIVSRLLAKDFLDKGILCAPFAQTLPGGCYYFVTTRDKAQRPDVMALKRWMKQCMAPPAA